MCPNYEKVIREQDNVQMTTYQLFRQHSDAYEDILSPALLHSELHQLMPQLHSSVIH